MALAKPGNHLVKFLSLEEEHLTAQKSVSQNHTEQVNLTLYLWTAPSVHSLKSIMQYMKILNKALRMARAYKRTLEHEYADEQSFKLAMSYVNADMPKTL